MKTWADWETIHQPYELDYHTNEGIEWCSDEERFTEFWGRIFDFIGVSGACLDVGCGPRPPFGSDSVAVDPLADEYLKLVPHWWDGIESHAFPAERFIPDLADRFDTVLCWNCLDHTIGWKQILSNLAIYGRKGATYAIATDFNPPHPGHPGFDRREFFAQLGKFKILKQQEDFQERQLALVLRVT